MVGQRNEKNGSKCVCRCRSDLHTLPRSRAAQTSRKAILRLLGPRSVAERGLTSSCGGMAVESMACAKLTHVASISCQSLSGLAPAIDCEEAGAVAGAGEA